MSNEVIVRMSFFLGIFGTMAIWEIFAHYRTLIAPKQLRWLSNLGIVFLNSVLLQLFFPILAVEFALQMNENQVGLLNYIQFPYEFKIFVSIILFDLAIYSQHLIFHKVPLLWRMHKVHHIDIDFDVTTGLRFHPLEIILSMFFKFAIIILLGTPAISVLLFEVILNGMAMFNHSNISLPTKIEKLVRFFFVTPDMHRVHHSVLRNETNSNYGFNLSLWDKLFKTYIERPKNNPQNMKIGLEEFRDRKFLRLHWILALPFLKN